MPRPEATFDEAPLEAVERSFERLLATGAIGSVAATADDLTRARVPDRAGAVFLRVARSHKELKLRDAEVRICLHEGAAADDQLGGWRLRADPPEIDIRVCVEAEGDRVFDATWSPQGGDDVVVHSTILHLLVRAVLGDRL